MLFSAVIIIGILSGFLTLFINYCIGKPASEFSPYEIFSSYTVFLSKKRLKSLGLWSKYQRQFQQGISLTNSKTEIISFKNDFKKMLYEAAEPYFTWERAVGMCPVCTGVWVAIISGLYFTQNILYLLIIIVVSHITIRLLNKIL